MSTDYFDDDYDPLAPMIDAAPADVDEAARLDEASWHSDSWQSIDDDVTDDELFDDDAANVELFDDELIDDDEGDGGIGGGNGIVRIWVEDDGRISKVRVSPVWFQRLGPGRTLEQAFLEAFGKARMRVAEPGVVESPSFDDADFGEIPPLTPENISLYVRMMNDHRERWLALVEEAAQEPPAPVPTFRGKSAGVVVTLTDAGFPSQVEFDEKWLDDAQVGSICINVSAAATKAYEQFERYVPEANERDEEIRTMEAELEYMMAGFYRLFEPRR